MLSFPRGMRLSSLEERRSFYSSEFDIDCLSAWIGDRRRNLKFAMILGRHSGVFVQKHASERNDVIIIDDWRRARDVQAYALQYLPESLYYDRNRYVDVTKCRECAKGRLKCARCDNFTGQQLAFDIDPENVDCPYHGHIGDKLQAGRGLSFCMYEFKAARRQAYDLSAELKMRYDDVSVVYSGRGFHVVVDDEPAYSLSRRQRSALAHEFGKRYDIDEWVTVGGSRLMRLPYSLNALVSRKCMIIKWGRDLLSFDPRTSREVTPRFMRSS